MGGWAAGSACLGLLRTGLGRGLRSRSRGRGLLGGGLLGRSLLGGGLGGGLLGGLAGGRLDGRGARGAARGATFGRRGGRHLLGHALGAAGALRAVLVFLTPLLFQPLRPAMAPALQLAIFLSHVLSLGLPRFSRSLVSMLSGRCQLAVPPPGCQGSLPHKGMLPCFFGGTLARLAPSWRSARTISGRVRRGSMMASTKPRSAAM